MRIVLIGYGKMGRAIETAALAKGHEIVARIDVGNRDEWNSDTASRSDVAIEFTGPHSAFSNVCSCLELGIPVVCGSTGWLDNYTHAVELCHKHDGAFLYASNFSIGVNIFFEVNRRLAKLMSGHPEYDVDITEIHHTQKKDAPSGTAISLAEQMIEELPGKTSWTGSGMSHPSEIQIKSERIDPYPGLHRVKYRSEIDEIEIVHNAHSRTGFASGAVLAAEFLQQRKGVYSMKDVLGIGAD